MKKTVLVLGGGGFIAGFIVAALRRAGHTVICAVPHPQADAPDQRPCDLTTIVHAHDAIDLLEGVDAVVNAAGILRETRGRPFDAVHYHGPLAVAQACVDKGIRNFVQVSALGTENDGAFITSKHRLDAALLTMDLDAVVLRPSVVYSTRGSYGGTSALRAHAAWPGVLLIPGTGEYEIQPVAAEDLAGTVVGALQTPVSGSFDVVGPEVITLGDYLRSWRSWLGFGRAMEMRIPERLVTFAAHAAEMLGRGPMGTTTWGMLINGNTAEPAAHARLESELGIAPRALRSVMESDPSQVQDRWHARLHALAPVLQIGLVMLMFLSALAGFLTSEEEIRSLVRGTAMESVYPVALARVAAITDLILGLALMLFGPRTLVMAATFSLVAVYTAVFGILLPDLWLEPLGGMAKNLVVLPAIAALWVLGDKR